MIYFFVLSDFWPLALGKIINHRHRKALCPAYQFYPQVILVQKYFLHVKKYRDRGLGAVNLDTFPIKYVRYSFLPK